MNTTTGYPPSVMAADNYSYREREWRAPKIEMEEEIIFDEPGRVLPDKEHGANYNVDCRSHFFRVVKGPDRRYILCVRHGGGDERFTLDCNFRSISGLRSMSSDDRYWMLFLIAKLIGNARREGAEREGAKYRKAFSEGRLKKRKIRNSEASKVWIES
jgi:hypothetical protein